MDWVAPAIMFAVGFGGAILARRLLASNRFRRSQGFPVEKGAVRLEKMGRKKRRRK